ncbi:AtzE family amidohydrolase [Novosphingobium taihuense]|uniref:Aspartyl-tRNA(Asn)/glutamyl-tRNA(Gln) amidotransferase subunit A n=1 Tax=Novosphingobium taihuense TaxID=260085 RepID=A0A7W7EU85_9SPHN|nr:AtzE family amidohydrolase [Novosphingobium taihuense]MBB4614148.1 aspartyl-tRNA(Asn)/glutamyl-tRNA(Gln) amidotransferase subunit A [Novosphingobium taihuense]TWH86998.1 aspartyl-tRNA(Asn)/glutamyl-tRNA(Gln) amidotransferase subunit A [Novosphingobium taihuense]
MRSAVEIAAAVRAGQVSASTLAAQAIAALKADAHVAVTRILEERALAEAAAVDALVARGDDPGPLAGVPYGVKDLFDVEGLPTTAGSAVLAGAAPAQGDAEAVCRLQAAGAVLVATLNMDEFAYGFATINATYGTTRNPHDPARLAGGSSGGSAAVVAAGLVPIALGSDTNGSIRVPASLCGLYGLKCAHGSLPVAGTYPFAESFDDIGPFTANLADMALVWGVLRGEAVPEWTGDVRIARLGGRFHENADPAQLAAIDAIAAHAPLVELPDIARARSAAFLITAFEGGHLHRDTLATRAMDYDPAVRDRLIAGALLPDELYGRALAFRADFLARLEGLIADFDVLVAPATPCSAPLIEDPRIMIDGALSPARADLGIHTQPITFTGLPSLAVPLHRPGALPLGLQLIGKPGGEGALLALAARLENEGLTGVSAPERSIAGELI